MQANLVQGKLFQYSVCIVYVKYMSIYLKLLVKFLLENGHRVCSSQSSGRKKRAAAVEPDAGDSTETDLTVSGRGGEC